MTNANRNINIVEPVSFSDIKYFLERFEKHHKSVEKLKIENDRQRYGNLFSGLNAIKSIYVRLSKHLAFDYNIFSILRNLKTNEEITHSPFLANLLDINGSHCQGDLFFRNFISQLFEKENDCKKILKEIDKDYFFVNSGSKKTGNFYKIINF